MTTHNPVRGEINDLVDALLLGPLKADEELSSPPADTYLTGILWPEGEPLSKAEDETADGPPTVIDAEVEHSVPGYRAIRPCSIGITFAAARTAMITVSLGGTARYTVVNREAETGKGKESRYWRRIELGYQLIIPPGEAGKWRTNDFIDVTGKPVHDVDVTLHVRRRIDGEQQILTVTLINSAVETEDRGRDEVCLFQSGVTITADGEGGRGAITHRKGVVFPGGDDDARSAALLYRNDLEYAVGHGIAASWSEPISGCVHEVGTTWLPTATVKGMSADGHRLLEEFRQRHPEALDAAWLARPAARDEVVAALQEFVRCYVRWIDEQIDARLGEIPQALLAAAYRNRDLCRHAAVRMERGLQILTRSSQTWQAFVLMNLAMDRQSRSDAKKDRKGPLRWRPFQLAYILLVIPGLAEPDDDDRDCMDLLWFPTGGGKTEAYLGLTAFEIFLRRLTVKERRDRGGTDVIMRYTLRLLTVQQFQRAAALICACDALRHEHGELGRAPISLGLYVGSDATPNRIEAARSALAEERDDHAPRSTPRQLLSCPVCGEDMPPRSYSMTESGDLEIRCLNKSCVTHGKPLPVLTVDDHIYAAPPSLLIGTIDKFAQLPRQQQLRSLFGLDGGCRPGLIIQDELHLISGPLGSMTGLYETVVDLLCTTKGIRPKVIGSTATIGQAARQVRALFDRPVLQFPPSGLDAADSFFAVRDEEGPDRIYKGVCSAGRSPKFALQAAAAALLQSAHHLRSPGRPLKDIDPFWTTVLYFNSLRELGGAHVLMQDDVLRQMAFLAARLGGKTRPLVPPIELSSRVPSRELPEKLLELDAVVTDDPMVQQAADTVLASNMISVGVDVSRLGLMMVNGQPKSTAEYIQATSRIGRGRDGLVVTLYNFGRPRDVSHFEHFKGYHAALYRAVEATSVTPWAPRARDKALHAVVIAIVRHLIPGMEDDQAAASFDMTNPEVQRLLALVRQRAASSSGGMEAEQAVRELDAIVATWAQRSRAAQTQQTRLRYWERKAPYGNTAPHLMASAEEGKAPSRQAWPTPNSMREVEPSTAFSLKRFKKGE